MSAEKEELAEVHSWAHFFTLPRLFWLGENVCNAYEALFL